MSAAPDETALADRAATGSPDQISIVTGRLSDLELAAVGVALAAVNAASRAEAHQRALSPGTAVDCGWDDAVHRLPGMYAARSQATATAWQFSHR